MRQRTIARSRGKGSIAIKKKIKKKRGKGSIITKKRKNQFRSHEKPGQCYSTVVPEKISSLSVELA